MFCPNCGTNNPDGSKFCSECGTVFNAEAETVAETAKQTVDQIIEGITPSQSADGDKPTVDQIIEEIAPEKPAEPVVSEPIPEQPAAPVMLEKPAAPEQPVMPEQPVAPMMSEQPVAPMMPEQPVAPQISEQLPQQPMPQFQQPMQPQQPMMQQPPMYGQPYPQQPVAPRPPKPPRKPLNLKQKKLLVIGCFCGAVLVAFLIVLFTAIIPHSGLKGKLRYAWTRSDSSRSYVMDLKSKRLIAGGTTYPITNWQASGDRLAITYRDGLDLETETYVVAFSPDGKKLYLFDSYGYDDGDRPDMVFVRGNNVQANATDLLW